jgi:soluble lytic murein transglycosylase-like protein
MTEGSGPSPVHGAGRWLLRLAAIVAVLVAGGHCAWRQYREPVEAGVRDYLAYRRVHRHEDALRVAALESGVDACLLAGLMVAESSGRVDARSRTGALGLFQLSPASARWRAEELGLPEPSEQDLLTDATLNARLGADNLAWLLDTYDGDVERALCAYNTGARRLKEIVDPAGGWEAWKAERETAADSTLWAYVRRVLHYRDVLRERGFFADLYPAAPAAEAAGVSLPGSSVEGTR